MLTFILLALGMISMTIFLLFRTREGGLIPAILKTLTSLLFIATAVSAAANNFIVTGAFTTCKLTYMGLVIIGLVCGLVGDLTLDLKITYQASNLHHSDIYTFFGMGSFGIGHILYIVAVGLFFGFSAWTLLIAAVVTTAVFCLCIFAMKMRFGKFLIPTIFYTFLLTLFFASTIAAGILTAFTAPVTLLVIGSALFLLSDFVLSMTYFNGIDHRVMIVANHLLYYSAQFLIALSLYYVTLPL